MQGLIDNGFVAKKLQINVFAVNALRWAYDALEMLGKDKAAIAAAGLLLLVERPDLRDDALDRFRRFEKGEDAPASESDAVAWVRARRASAAGAAQASIVDREFERVRQELAEAKRPPAKRKAR